MSRLSKFASAALAALLAAVAATGLMEPATAHDTSGAALRSEQERDLPPCSSRLEAMQDCHIHDRQTFREMRVAPPDEARPHAHDEFEREEEEWRIDTRGRI